jgi:hypothetical protein
MLVHQFLTTTTTAAATATMKAMGDHSGDAMTMTHCCYYIQTKAAINHSPCAETMAIRYDPPRMSGRSRSDDNEVKKPQQF